MSEFFLTHSRFNVLSMEGRLGSSDSEKTKGPVTSHIHQARDDLLLTRQTPSKGDNLMMIQRCNIVSDFRSNCGCDSLLITGLVSSKNFVQIKNPSIDEGLIIAIFSCY